MSRFPSWNIDLACVVTTGFPPTSSPHAAEPGRTRVRAPL